MTITLRQESDGGATTKGSSLTYAELDNNFIDLIAKLDDVVSDTSPQLGGSLDVNGNSIVSTSDGNITIAPNGTGDIVLGTITIDGDQTVGAGQDNHVLTYDNATGKIQLEAVSAAAGDVVDDTSPQLGGDLDMNGNDIVTTSNADLELAPNGTGHVTVRGNTNAGAIQLNCENNTHGQQIQAQPHSAGVTNELLLPGGSDSTLVSEDATQTLKDKTLEDYAETVHAIGSNDSPGISVSNGNIQTVTITSGLALPAFTDAAAGQTVTLIVSGSGSASGTGTYKFAGGNKTLTNDSIVSIHTPDGTNYFASIATDFQA